MEKKNNTIKLSKQLGKLLFGLIIAFSATFWSSNVNAQCKISADFKFNVKGNKVSFADNSRGAHKVLAWKFGDGHVKRRSKFVRHVYSKPGSYNVCLIIYGRFDKKNNKRCLDTICKKVVVKNNCDKINANFKHRIYANRGYFGAKKYKGAKYTWSFGDGSARENGRLIRHKFAKPGTYNVCLQIKTRDCTKLVCKKITIKNPCDRISKNFAYRIKDNRVYFAAQRYRGAKYTWSFGDGSDRKHGRLQRHKYAKTGTYKVCLQIKTRNCVQLICKEIKIKDRCDYLIADYKFRIEGKEVHFKSKEYKNAKYTWAFGDGTARANGLEVKHRYTKPGKYKVCLQIKTRDCVKVVCKEIIIKDPCSYLKADFAFRMDGITFKFISKNTDAAYFRWNFGDGTYSKEEHVKHTFKKPGVYTVCLTVKSKDEKCQYKVCKKVVVASPCDRLKADFVFAVHGKDVKFESKNSNGAYFLWSFGDGTYSKDQQVKHTFKKAGFYHVCLTVWTKDKKCKVQVCKKVTIKQVPGMRLYPNPAINYTTVTHNLGLKNTLLVKDLNGNVIIRVQHITKTYKLNISHLRKGVYTVVIEDSNRNRVFQKLIKQ